MGFGEGMTTRKPELSLYLGTFTDAPQHDWRATLDLARAMDEAGVDRLVVSDHVVFGENLDAYAEPQGIQPLPKRAILRATALFTVPLIHKGTPPGCTGLGIW